MKPFHLKKTNTARKIVNSFMVVILVGAILLTLPISNRNAVFLNPLDAFFTAVSATCVTGLTTVTTMHQFNLFGQIIILIMMQVGGIGLMTLVAVFAIALKIKFSMENKKALIELLNPTDLFHLKHFLRDIVKYVVFFESIGAILLMVRFIPQYGMKKGIFNSIFIAVSAFCNAGFDNLSEISLIPYQQDAYVLSILMMLIVLGGVGFVVWFDVRDKIKPLIRRKITLHRFFESLSLHTKIVLIATLFLIVIPAVMFGCMEANNLLTMQNLSIKDKIVNSLFTSITLRTAGFASLSMDQFYMSSHLLMILCMYIGGSPGGTAGGIKTTTLAVVLICIGCMLKGKRQTNAFHRHISRDVIVRATSIITINMLTLFTGIFILSITENFSFMEIVYECTSALATVGLSLGITPLLSTGGKLVIIMLMLVGRIGIMTFIMSLVKEDRHCDVIHYADGHVLVG